MTRASLRDAHGILAAAMDKTNAAAETVARAQAAMQSDERLAAEAELIDDKIARYRTAELRSGTKPGALPDHMIETKRRCDEAVATVAASRIALATLRAEQEEAEAEEAAAHAAVAEAAIAVIRAESSALAYRLRGATAYRDRLLHELQDLAHLWVPLREPVPDGFHAGAMLETKPIDLPPDAVATLNPPPMAIRVPDAASWNRYLAALRADPEATKEEKR